MAELPPDPTIEDVHYLELCTFAAKLTYERTHDKTDKRMLLAYLGKLIDLIEAPGVSPEARYR